MKKSPSEKTVAGITFPPPTLGRNNRSGPNPVTSFGPALKALQLNWKPALITSVVGIGLGLVPQVVDWLLPVSRVPSVTIGILAFEALLLPIIIITSSMLLVIAVASANHRAISTREALKQGLGRTWALIGMGLLSWLIVSVGLLLLFIPGIIAAFRLVLAPYIMYDRGMGPVASMKLSNELMKRSSSQIIGISVLLTISYLVAIALDIVFPHVGPFVTGLPLELVAMVGSIYFVWLYRDILEVKLEGYKGLYAGATNITLGIVAGLLIPLAMVGFVVWVVTQGISNVPYGAKCYQIQVPKIFEVEQASTCHIFARSALRTFEYRPLADSSADPAALAASQKDKLFPPDRFETVDGPAADIQSIDVAPAAVYTLHDKQTDTTITVAFTTAPTAYDIDGVPTRSFVFIDTPVVPAGNSSVDVREFSSLFATIETSVVWAP